MSGSGFNSPETRSATVALEGNFQPPVPSQTISLSDIQSGAVTSVTFSVTFDPILAGTTQTLTATIDPRNALNESNFSNNMTTVEVDVVAPYKIVATVNGSQGSEFNLPPTQLTDPGCSATLLPYVPSSLPVNLQCIDTSSGKAVAGCSFNLQLAPGSNNGGHSHGGDHPLACLPSGPFGCPTITNLLTQGQKGSIDQAGTTLNYGAPEVSGDVVLTITGADPNGNGITSDNLPAPITFHVQANGSPDWLPLSNVNVDVIINGADSSPSHPLGYYGTSVMANAVDLMGEKFVNALSATETAPSIYSQAASLPWGGIYDIQKDWDTPHCGHRDGMTIDLSLWNLDNSEKKVLARVAKKSGLGFFYVPESPSNPTANHWHATLIQGQ